ncbi:hypothetical protein EGW08_012450 [Elysia chlorotica]|uniref:G-protein coupled receptors family 1 profile domain-containing protein n=1 Tax=Elysia chlorotica TaxID=188477 RepID=A0A433TE54_ELYCH|nr:hypothetical protein EGW08_012450 [Elysia chlorotica]
MALILVTWCLSLLYGTVPLYTSHAPAPLLRCVPTQVLARAYFLHANSATFLLSCLVILSCYLQIARVFFRHRRQIVQLRPAHVRPDVRTRPQNSHVSESGVHLGAVVSEAQRAESLNGQRAGSLSELRAESLNGQRAESLSELRAESLNEQRAESLNGQRAESLSGQRVESLNEQRAESLSELRAESLNGQRAESLNEQRAESLNEERAESLNEQRAESLNEQRVESLGEKKAETLSELRAESLNGQRAESLNEQRAESLGEKKAESLSELRAESLHGQRAESLNEQRAESLNEQRAESLNDQRAEILNDQRAESLNEKKAETLSEKRAGSLNEQRAESLNEQRVESLGEQRAETLSEQRAESLSEQRAESLSEQRAESLSEQRAETLNDQRAESLNEQRTEVLCSNGKELVEQRLDLGEIIVPDFKPDDTAAIQFGRPSAKVQSIPAAATGDVTIDLSPSQGSEIINTTTYLSLSQGSEIINTTTYLSLRQGSEMKETTADVPAGEESEIEDFISSMLRLQESEPRYATAGRRASGESEARAITAGRRASGESEARDVTAGGSTGEENKKVRARRPDAQGNSIIGFSDEEVPGIPDSGLASDLPSHRAKDNPCCGSAGHPDDLELTSEDITSASLPSACSLCVAVQMGRWDSLLRTPLTACSAAAATPAPSLELDAGVKPGRMTSILEQGRLAGSDACLCPKHLVNTGNTFIAGLEVCGEVRIATMIPNKTMAEMLEEKQDNPLNSCFEDCANETDIIGVRADEVNGSLTFSLQKNGKANPKDVPASDVDNHQRDYRTKITVRDDFRESPPSTGLTRLDSRDHTTAISFSEPSGDHAFLAGHTSTVTSFTDISGQCYNDLHSHGFKNTTRASPGFRRGEPMSPPRLPSPTPGRSSSPPAGSGHDIPSRLRAARFLATVCGIFMLCWTPLVLSVLAYYTMGGTFQAISACTTLAVINSAVNFFIYAAANKDFRHAFKVLLCGR